MTDPTEGRLAMMTWGSENSENSQCIQLQMDLSRHDALALAVALMLLLDASPALAFKVSILTPLASKAEGWQLLDNT